MHIQIHIHAYICPTYTEHELTIRNSSQELSDTASSWLRPQELLVTESSDGDDPHILPYNWSKTDLLAPLPAQATLPTPQLLPGSAQEGKGGGRPGDHVELSPCRPCCLLCLIFGADDTAPPRRKTKQPPATLSVYNHPSRRGANFLLLG